MKFVRGLAALAAAAWITVAFANDVRDAGVLRVERFGASGTPIILVPGLASGSWVWRDTIDALTDTHRVYAVTLAGFDGRPAAAGDPMRAALEALRALVVEEKRGKPVVIGHSLGGMLGLQLAAAYPDLVGGVVTVDGLPVLPTTENVPAAQRSALGERMRAQFADVTQAEFEAQQLAYMRRVGVIDDARAVLRVAAARRTRARGRDHRACASLRHARPAGRVGRGFAQVPSRALARYSTSAA